MIKGVHITLLKQMSDKRGKVMHMLKPMTLCLNNLARYTFP